MEVKGNTGSLSQSIAVSEIAAQIKRLTDGLAELVTVLICEFSQKQPTPQSTFGLENSLIAFVTLASRCFSGRLVS